MPISHRLLLSLMLLLASMTSGVTPALAEAQGQMPEPVVLNIPAWQDAGHPQVSQTTPLTSGLPLAQSLLTASTPVTITDASGRDIPHQITPLAFWIDGSFKWVSITLLAGPQDQLPYKLVWGRSADASNWPRITITRDGQDQVSVHTGALQFSIGPAIADSLIHDLSLTSSQGATPRRIGYGRLDAQIARARRAPQAVHTHWLQTRQGALVDGAKDQVFLASSDHSRTMTIEQEGPIVFIARLQGRHGGRGDEGFAPYDIRVYAYAGSTALRVQHSFIFDGDPQTDVITSLQLMAPLESPRKLALGQSEGPVLQGPADTLRVLQLDSDTLAMGDEKHQGRLTGWAQVDGGATPVAAAVRDAWRLYPKRFSVADNRLNVELWPQDDQCVLSLARTSDATGPGENLPGDKAANAVGVSRTHDVVLDFAADQDRAAQWSRMLDHPPMFFPSTQYMTGTKVLGPLAPQRNDLFPQMEAFLSQQVYALAANQDKFKWYGMIDYGDVRDKKNSDVWDTQGRYGWRHGSGDVQFAILTHYLRTGEETAWRLGSAYARHVTDVDTVHFALPGSQQELGLMHRRGQDHWSGSAMDAYTYGRGLALYHYLSGDLRPRSVLLEEITIPASDPSNSRHQNASQICIIAFEMTGLDHWKQMARKQIDHVLHAEYGGFRLLLTYMPTLSFHHQVTGDPDSLKSFIGQVTHALDPATWESGQSYTGGPFLMVSGLLYHETKDATLAVKYPAYLYQELLGRYQPQPREEWGADSIIKGTSSSSVGWLVGRMGYFFQALMDVKLTEDEVRNLPRPVSPGFPRTVHPVVDAPTGRTMPLKLTFKDGVDPLGDAFADRSLRTRNLMGLPFGSELVVNGVGFELPHPDSQSDGKVLPLIEADKDVSIDLSADIQRVHLLGPMVVNGFWSEGQTVMNLEITYADGQVERRPLRYLVEIDDLRGWHFATESRFGRYWFTAGMPVRHLDTFTVELSRPARSLRLVDGGKGYVSFILAATGETQDTKTATAPTMHLCFGNAAGGTGIEVVKADTLFDDNQKVGWVRSSDDLKKNQDNLVVSSKVGQLRMAVANGDYRVNVRVKNAVRSGGGILQMGTTGHHLDSFGLSSNMDELRLPARVKNGVLDLMLIPDPSLEGSWQTTGWGIEEVIVTPVEQHTIALRGDTTPPIFPGINLAVNSQASQTVGARATYSFRHLDQAIDNNTQSSYLLRANYPQDFILDFKQSSVINGVVLRFGQGEAVNKIRVQVPKDNQWRSHAETEYGGVEPMVYPDHATHWRDVAAYEGEPGVMTVTIPLKKVRTSVLRILMESGDARIKLLNLEAYGQPVNKSADSDAGE